jgi:hypothetical protein
MLPPEIESALGELCRDAARYFPEHGAPPEIGAVALTRRPLSDLARIDLRFPDAHIVVYAKVHRKAGGLADRVRHKAGVEFETLCFLHERFRSVPGCTVVRPIAFFPDEATVVTEAAVGENFHRLIKANAVAWRSQAQHDRLTQACRACGIWLHHFQRLTDQARGGRLRVADGIERVGADLKVCLDMGLSAADAARLLDFCETQLRRAEACEFPVVGVHPDFQPDNILIAPGTVTVLDFTSFQHGGPYSDAARFVATLEAFRKNPLYGRGISRLMTSFLEGYGPPSEAMRPLFIFYVMRHLIRITGSVRAWRHPCPLNRLLERRAVAFLAGWQRRLQSIEAALGAVPA